MIYSLSSRCQISHGNPFLNKLIQLCLAVFSNKHYVPPPHKGDLLRLNEMEPTRDVVFID